jgi:threonine dehydrogenase-like Zn-dependent dehydrogenase
MRAVVTEGVDAIALRERPDPGGPQPGQVIVAPQAIGICGSDYHFLSGELSEAAGGSQFPRVQGHEVAATITAIGPDCREGLKVDQRVALYPLDSCGSCYPCRVGRRNTCDNFRLIGIHLDGGLQERLAIDQAQVFPIEHTLPAVASLAEPVSIAVRAVNRAGLQPGERVVILGAGPIGQCVLLVARERGAEVLMVDLKEPRLRLARELGAETLVWERASEVVQRARAWAAPAGPPVAIDATGAPPAVRAMIDMVASAGRAIQIGMSSAEVSIRIGSLTEKEIDVRGVCCCGGGEFGEAVGVVERNASRLEPLISHEFSLEQAPEALRFAMTNPDEVMKVVIHAG